MTPIKMPPVKYELIKLGGGLDQVTPTLSLPPGVARRASNFEASITGGYTRIAGYERFDGRPSPSGAEYAILVGTVTGSVAVGSTVVGVSSTATAVVIEINPGSLVVTAMSAYFEAGEELQVSGSPVMVLSDVTTAADGRANAGYQLLAANYYRQSIHEVPGSGPVRGVAYYNGDVYAWRNNPLGTAMVLHKSSPTGWTEVNLGHEINFGTGIAAIAKGNTLVGATSGATAVVTHIVVQDGDWTTGDAQGYITFASVTGAFQPGEALKVGGVTKATATSASAAVTLAPNGRVDSVVSNFGGYTETPSLYGVDGVNNAFELYEDGRYVRIRTGMAVDTPLHIAAHKNHLFLSFNSSVQHSAPGNPHNWDPTQGAGEISLNGDVTEFLVQPGDQQTGTMAIYTRSDTFMLYGTGSDTWNLTPYNVGTGAIPYTGQNMSASYVLDDRGVISLATTLNFGNFDTAALTLNIRPFVQLRRSLATASCVNREKAQYRVFFSDGTALYVTIANGKLLGAMPIAFPISVTCIVEGEKPDGSETSFFGSTNGYVYRLDAGGSFDGEPIPANLSLVYNAIKSPRILKRYRKASVELTGESYAEIDFGYDLGYRSLQIDQPADQTAGIDLRSSYWDSFVWDRFVWDGGEITPSEIELSGTAENLSIRISSVSNLFMPFTVNSVILHYTPRRGLR